VILVQILKNDKSWHQLIEDRRTTQALKSIWKMNPPWPQVMFHPGRWVGRWVTGVGSLVLLLHGITDIFINLSKAFPDFFFFRGSGWQDGWWVVDGPLMTYRIWWPGLDVYCGTNDLCHTTWWYMMYIVKYIYNHIHAILDPTTLGMFKLTLIWTAPARWSFWKSWRIYNLKREGWWFKSGRTGRSQAPQHTQTDS